MGKDVGKDIYKVSKKLRVKLDFSSPRRLKNSLYEVFLLQVRKEYADDIGPQVRALDEFESVMCFLSMVHSEEELDCFLKYRFYTDTRLKEVKKYKDALLIRDRVMKNIMLIGENNLHRAI